MKKILILGAKGMLGQALGNVFADSKPTLWDRDEIDITDEAAVLASFEQLRPEVVINAAAYTDVDQAESDEAAAMAVNEAGVGNVVRAASRIGAVVVHYSTDYVFNGLSEDGYDEASSPGPAVNAYGRSKLAGERVLVNSEGPFWLIRTAWLYGPGGKNFVDTMVGLSLDRDEVAVISDQMGSPTFTYDVARFTRQLLDGGYAPGIYHAVNEGVVSWYELAYEIFRVIKSPIKVKSIATAQYPLPAQRPRFSVLKNTKGPGMRSWKKALEEYLASCG